MTPIIILLVLVALGVTVYDVTRFSRHHHATCDHCRKFSNRPRLLDT